MKRSSFLRTLFCLALSFVLVLSFSAAAFAAEEAEAAETVETAAVDPLLVGQWYCYDRSDDGIYSSEVFHELRSLNICLPNGVFTESDTFAFANATGFDQLTVYAAEGETDLGQRLIDYALMINALEGSEVPEDVLDEISKLSDIRVTYELFDLVPEDVTTVNLIDSLKDALVSGQNDGLRIHVTASYKASPLSNQKVDSTFCYYREIPTYHFLEALVCGDWTDQNDNAWTIGFVLDEDGYTDLTFQMTASDGTVYHGEDFYSTTSVESDGTMDARIQFAFEEFDSPEYALGELTAESIQLLSEEGDLILARG